MSSSRPTLQELQAMKLAMEARRGVKPRQRLTTESFTNPGENRTVRSTPQQDSVPDSITAPSAGDRLTVHSGLPSGYRPSVAELRRYHQKWDTLNVYVAHEEALRMLFQELPDFRQNIDLKHIIVKCSVLNDFYSTNIYKIEPLAEHILAITDIDARLATGDETLVKDIAEGENLNRNYSFATKYCAHHQPDAFPIYDRYVDDVLWFLHTEYPGLMPFRRRKELQNYSTFKRSIEAVRDEFGLGEYSFKDIDRYLWQLGKDYYNPYIK